MKQRAFLGRLVLRLIFLGFWGLCGLEVWSGPRQTGAEQQVRSYPGGAYHDLSSDGAWCWFADPRAVYEQGNMYAGWVDRQGNIWVSQMDAQSRDINKVKLFSEFDKDDHANPALLMLPDGRIMIFYSGHGGKNTPMRYQVSKNPRDISVWSDEVLMPSNTGTARGFCYPNPVRLNDEDDRIYLFWRGGNWKPTFSFSDDLQTWSAARTLIQSRPSDSVRPYIKIDSNSKDRIHFAFTDGHPRNEPTNSIYYACYRAGALYKADGSKILDVENLPLTHGLSDLVFDGNKEGVRGWIWDVASDGQDRPVIVYTRLPAETDHRYYYACWDGERWLDHEICSAGKWFPQTPGEKKEPEPHYSGGVVLDHEDPSLVYLSREVKGVFEIEKWITRDGGETWSSESITADSTCDNVRPFVIRHHPGDEKPQVLWMYNREYVHYLNYDCAIKMNVLKK